MNKITVTILVTLITGGLMMAQEKNNTKGLHGASHIMIGYLVDQMCGKRMVMDDVKKSDAKAAKHTKDCALDETCKANGYGIVTGGKFYKFDDDGNKKAVDYLSATKKEDNIKVEVAGMMDGDHMNVESIKDLPSKGKKGETKK
jgi:hypothetical protein